VFVALILLAIALVICRRLVIVLQPTKRNLDGLFLAFADDDDIDGLADRAFSDDTRQIAHLVNVLAIELDDDIAWLDGAVVDRPALDDPGDQRPSGGCHVEAFGDIVRHRLDTHAKPATPRLAIPAQLVDHAGSKLRGNGKADADRSTRWRDDRGVDADDLAVHVEQRPAGIAAVDGGVRLDEIVIGTGIDVAVTGRNDAHRDRTAQTERIAHGHDPIADTHLAGIAELHRRQLVPLGIDLEHRDIGF